MNSLKKFFIITLLCLPNLFLASCRNYDERTLCANELKCAETWCSRDSRNYSSCMASHDDNYDTCEEALSNVWFRSAKCTDLYVELYDCVSAYIFCAEQYDVYLNRLHSIEQNECRNQYNKLLEHCAGL